MSSRLSDWWAEQLIRRGAAAVLVDIWMASLAIALLGGFFAGWLAHS